MAISDEQLDELVHAVLGTADNAETVCEMKSNTEFNDWHHPDNRSANFAKLRETA